TTEEIHLMCKEGSMKAIPFMAPFLANYRETMPWASEKPYIYSVVENTCDEAKLYDLDKTGKGIVIENILHRVKLYHDEEQLTKLTTEEIHLMCKEGSMKAIPFMAPFLANYCETMPWASEKPYIYIVVENTCDEAKLYDLDKTGKGIVIENI
nr:hypothetical protein [Tanacetum cinerariifolium]